MAQAQPQPQPEEPPLPPRVPVIHNAALAGAVLTPLAMLLPPRRMDIRFFVLAGAFSLSTNQLAYEYTGSSLYTRFGNRVSSTLGGAVDHLPEGAKRTQQLLREQREREAAEKRRSRSEGEDGGAKAGGLAELGNKVWMGSETEGWEQRRAEEHRRKLEEGKSISDLIMEQIADVWNGNWRGDAKKGSNDDESKPTEAERPEKK